MRLHPKLRPRSARVADLKRWAEKPRMEPEDSSSKEWTESLAWWSLAAAIVLPPLGTAILFEVTSLEREGGRSVGQLFALAEVATMVGGIIACIASAKSSILRRIGRLLMTLIVGSVGAYWLFALAGLAGSKL